jgi:flavodoxin I
MIMSQIGLFYGSTTGNTEFVATLIAEEFAKRGLDSIELFDIGRVELSQLMDYDNLIIGCPTWNIGQLQDDWDIAESKLSQLDFTGKKVALFGLGDQYGYPENFCDAIGMLGQKFSDQGAELVGFTLVEDYDISYSLGIEEGVFLGLALDEDNQNDLTPSRIQDWVTLLIQEFGLTVPVLV